jgi:nicotinic acid mononucleotide adenylyltransferase
LSTEHVTASVRERIVDLRGAEREGIARALDEQSGPQIYVTDAVLMDVSATEIRRFVREGRTAELSRLVPPPVADYIRKYRLYTE